MDLQRLLQLQLKRLNPYPGLLIDVPTWAEAHDYHRLQQRLHALALHRPGVVAGLEVTAWDPPDTSVVVHPGVALDPDGNVIVVPERLRLTLEARGSGTMYLVLQYREVASGSAPLPSTGGEERQATHIAHAFRIVALPRLPEEPYLELARVRVSGRAPTIGDAADPLHPAVNELDLRYRLTAGPVTWGHIRIGVVRHDPATSGDDAPLHEAGLWSLARSLERLTPFSAEYVGAVDLAAGPPPCHLLFLNGTTEVHLEEGQEVNLRAHLDRGGVLVGEACRSRGDREGARAFDLGFARLAERLGRRLQTVKRGQPVLDSFFLFSAEPPTPYGEALLMEHNGMVFSAADYGCVWAGGVGNEPVPRETIRAATELGVNLAALAHQRTVRSALRGS